MNNNQSFDQLIEKWSPVLNEESAGSIKDHHRKAVTAAVLENQERAIMEERQASAGFMTEAAPTNSTGGNVNNWDPILISLVRRAMPNLMAYDLCGVQPMSGPTGLIFAMRSKYGNQGAEALGLQEPDSAFSGKDTSSQSGDPSGLSAFDPVDPTASPSQVVDTMGRPMGTSEAEALGAGGNGGQFNEMSFSIEKTSVEAKSRALRAEYSLELAQDLKAIHGLDAETELANILSTEILAEINREIVRTINTQAILGAQQQSVAVKGAFDLTTDADGRWSAEKFKGLAVQIEREANAIAKATRRGKGNIVICSSDVATALAASGQLDYTAGSGMSIDDTGNTFVGTLNGRIRVFIDPYATQDFITVGYKGTNPYDAGMFYCPYVPLQMVKAVAEDTFQPRIGFKTRYGMAVNPFVFGDNSSGLHNMAATAGKNTYYRIFRVDNLMVASS
jgi:hypothetical protein